MKIKPILAVSLFTLLSACASTQNKNGIEVTGLNDNFEKSIKVDTYNYTKPFMIMGGSEDYFFRAFIDKSDKSTSYQLYITTNSPDWMFWDSITYLENEQPKELKAKRVGSDVECSQYGCAHYEDTIINLPKKLIEKWTTTPNKIRIRSSKYTEGRDIEIDPSEVAELIKKVELVKGQV